MRTIYIGIIIIVLPFVSGCRFRNFLEKLQAKEYATVTTPPPGCYKSGKYYPPGSEISFGQEGNWCYWIYCNSESKIVPVDDYECIATEIPEPIPTTTITLPPSLPPGCYDGGKYYPPGSEISSGQSGNWCYVTYCDTDGNIISGDSFDCSTTPPTTTTAIPTPPRPPTTTTTTLPPPLPPGCIVGGKYFPPDTQISSGQSGSWCYFTYCDSDGNVISGDNFDCTTKGTTTTTVPTTTTTKYPGCFYEGKYYRPGSEISSGQSGTWCYSTYCDSSGNILNADNFDCSTKGPSTTTTTTISENMCFFEGKHYPADSYIKSDFGETSCSDYYCGSDGSVAIADNFDCADCCGPPQA